MTFEEFFKKKKIDLDQLAKAEPSLFAEFEAHYAVMGEKSFDHTKKYWFNELRRKYHTPEEVKAEKVHIENQIAEQTVTESIIEMSAGAPAPKLGFKPKFKVPVPAAAETTTAVPEEPKIADPTESTPAPKLGFKPKFKAPSPPKTIEQSIAPPEEKEPDIAPKEPEPTSAPKLGFKPKFKPKTGE